MFLILGAMLGEALPPAVARAPTARIEPQREARLAQARWLIDLFHPEAEMVASNMAMWAIRVRRSGQADRAMAKIEDQYPGALEAYLAGARPVAIRNATQFVRTAKSRKAAVLADRLSGFDLARLIQFYRTPVGAKLLLIQQQPGDLDRILRRARSGEMPPIDEKVATRDRDEQKKRSVRALSADELVEVLKFQSDPVAIRYADAIAAADRDVLALIRNPDVARLAHEHEAGTRNLDAHIARIKRARP